MFKLRLVFAPLAVLIALSLCTANIGRADTASMYLSGVNGATATVGYNAYSSNTFYQPTIADVYAGPYTAVITNGANPAETLEVFCDDFPHEADEGVANGWTANITPFSDLYSGTATDVRFQQSTALATLTTYEEGAWLVEQMSKAGSSQYAAYSIALWTLFNQTVTKPYAGFDHIWLVKNARGAIVAIGGPDWRNSIYTTAAGYLAQAENLGNSNSFTPGEFDNFTIYTPVCSSDTASCSGTSQEFLSFVTPEPGSLALFGIGLFLMVVLVRRKMSYEA